jgi:NADH:ubiquinone oxidoreductase subunit F (NADH-binding)
VTLVEATGRHVYPGRGRPGDPRLLAGLAGHHAGGPQVGLHEHERFFGPLPLPTARGGGYAVSGQRAAGRLIDVIERSGLTGRGGAGFPAGRKLRSVADGAGSAVVVANGSEGEPASHKDQLLLRRAPHLVLDGISLAAFAVRATEAYLVVHGANRRLVASLLGAVQARKVADIDQVAINVVGIEHRYVASEQTAIVRWINGGPGLPTFAPPRTHERGVGGRPTAVNNVETLAHIALIARYGSDWFRQAGTPDAPGTALTTVTGAIRRPGVYEIELGTPIGDLLMRAGGPAERPQAVLVGGYFGTWLPVEVAWQARLSGPGLRLVSAAMGAGILVVLPESSCGLAESARVVRYLANESAGQCGPCVFGLPALARAMTELAHRGGSGDGVDQIASLIPLIERRGACRHPDGVTQLAASALTAFRDDARMHDVDGPCPGVRRPSLLPIPREGLAR